MIFIKKFTSFFLSLLLNLNVLVPGNVNAVSDSPKKVSCNPRITEEMIKEVKEQGFFQNSNREVEDGFSIVLTTLDFFEASDYSKLLYDPLITSNMRLLLLEEAQALTNGEISKAALNNALDSFWWVNPINWFYGKPKPREVDFERHDLQFFIDKLDKIDSQKKVGDAEKYSIAQFMVDNQLKFEQIKQEIIKKGYEKIDAESRATYSAAAGAGAGGIIGTFLKWAAKKKLGEISIKHGLALLGVSSGACAAVFGLGALSDIYFEHKYNIAKLNEVNHKRDAIAYGELIDRVSAAKEKANELIENGKWVGANAFYSVVPTHPDCHVNPISMFLHREELDEPDERTTIENLAHKTCVKRGCTDNNDIPCRDFIIEKVDKCVRNHTAKRCSLVSDFKCDSSSMKGDL